VIQKASCPSTLAFSSVFALPFVILALVPLIGVPLYLIGQSSLIQTT